MMSVHELFYGDAEPVWIIGTAAAPIVHHMQLKIASQFSNEQHSSPHFKSYQPNCDNHHHDIASQRDLPQQSGQQHHQRHQSPLRNSPQYQTPQHNRNKIFQNNASQHSDDQHHQQNQKQHQRQRSPLHQSSPNRSPHQHSTHVNSHQPSAPSIDAHHHYNSQEERFTQYRRPEVKVVKLKVPICCEACEDRVVGSLSTMRGVQSVECDLRKERVTVIGNAAPADILKACKKLFKRSEIWEDRYY